MTLMTICLVGTLTWTNGPISHADELSDAKAKLIKLQGEASAAEQEYHKVEAQLETASTKLIEIEKEIEVQQEKVEALRTQVTVVTLQQFQDRGATTTAVLFTSDNQEEALNRIVMASLVSDTTTALLQSYQLSQSQLDILRRGQQSTVAAIKASEEELKLIKAAADAKVTETQRVVNRLSAEQRARLDAENGGFVSRTGSFAPPPPVQNGPAAAAIVAFVMSKVGGPYKIGGEGPVGYDCSGLTKMAYASIGISLPHSAASQFNYGRAVSKEDLQPGDLVFFYRGPGHVGIYVGGGMIADARNSRVGIVYTSINAGMPFVGARRLL
ncbi:MAG: C40 family peptidase [Propionibacteriaceae bacterium]|jgi:cell wall-associated NlpC family hydrolase|nr:C40 family peptidase [Propionibacteriaceae bacterium]